MTGLVTQAVHFIPSSLGLRKFPEIYYLECQEWSLFWKVVAHLHACVLRYYPQTARISGWDETFLMHWFQQKEKFIKLGHYLIVILLWVCMQYTLISEIQKQHTVHLLWHQSNCVFMKALDSDNKCKRLHNDLFSVRVMCHFIIRSRKNLSNTEFTVLVGSFIPWYYCSSVWRISIVMPACLRARHNRCVFVCHCYFLRTWNRDVLGTGCVLVFRR
jgi:hypothetical protein